MSNKVYLEDFTEFRQTKQLRFKESLFPSLANAQKQQEISQMIVKHLPVNT